jgi:two-component system NtrC family sensor kinase
MELIRMNSLRGKILASYGVSKLALIIFVAIVIGDLHYLKTHIVEGEVVNELYVASEKIRRDEKNLFLYNDSYHLEELQLQLELANKALDKGRRMLSAIIEPGELQQIEAGLKDYEGYVSQYPDAYGPGLMALQNLIQLKGNQLSKLTQNLNERQRVIMTETIKVATRTLMIASLTVILLGFGSAMFMVRRVCRPVAQLEKQLDQLAQGNIQSLNLPSDDKEIESFVFHFNTMLEQLREQQTQLRRHERAAAMGVLVSGVAHELNNPLSNISTSVQLLMEDDTATTEDLRQQWLSHIDGETERARRIVKRLLDTVRQPTEQMQLYSAPILIQSAALLIHRQLPPDLILDIEEIEEGMLLVDRERMQQVFVNLIKNAANAGARNIWITAEKTTWKESRPVNVDTLAGDMTGITQYEHVMLIRVDDDGSGIDADHLPHIFDPFYTTKSGGEGTGLGLYLVEEIINEHRGCIAVENREEGGARFSIWLPLETTPETEEEIA